uniref:Uncharacterized protein n=1 Tax=Heterorhabditis bacteriophora TaxID=37862 RepID=A0A1I7WJ66_HETBA
MLFSPLLVIYTTRPPYYLSRAIGKQQKKSLDSSQTGKVRLWSFGGSATLYYLRFKGCILCIFGDPK